MNELKGETTELQKLDANQRREKVLELLSNANNVPFSATAMANTFGVSRQIIVGDIALLRASGLNIAATPKGYVYTPEEDGISDYGFIGMIACKHSNELLLDELFTIVDFGGALIDVTIDHPIYGQISGNLNIKSRYEANIFADKIKGCNAKQLCDLTDGTHLHKIGCMDESIFKMILSDLTKKGIAIE